MALQARVGRAGLARDPRGCVASGRRSRNIWLVLIAFTLMSGHVVMAPDEAAAGQAGTINSDGVALMADINDYTTIGTMYAGERVDVFWGPEAGLYQVRYYDTVGWVWAEYLDVDGGGGSSDGVGGGPAAPVTGSGGWAVVDAKSLNVRGDASTAAPIWDRYHNGDSVEVIGDPVNGFYPINYYGSTAWVAADFLSWGGSVAETAEPDPAVQVERWIDINRGTGLVTLYDGDTVYATYWGSLGYDQSDYGYNSTAVGTYHVYRMYQPLAYTPFANAYITDWVGFDPDRVNGFHSWTRDADGNVIPNGAGKTAGCVGLEPSQARALYDFAYIGMRVEIHN